MAERRPSLDAATAARLNRRAGRVTMREVPFPAQVGLRVAPDSPEAARIEAALGLALPAANGVASGGGRDVLWLGPDEWLVVGEPGSERTTESLLRDAIGNGFGVVVELSANRTVLEVEGPDARMVLAACCHLDLHRRAFGVGDCAQTLLQKAQIILQQTSDAPAYRLFVRPSFAAYVAGWLAEGAEGLA